MLLVLAMASMAFVIATSALLLGFENRRRIDERQTAERARLEGRCTINGYMR